MVQQFQKKYFFFRKYFCQKYFFKKKYFSKNIFDKNIFGKKYFFFNRWTKCSEMALKKDKFWYFKKSLFAKSFVNFSPFPPANMVPASGGHLSGGWNHAGLFSFDLILSELLLEHDIFKIDFISWAPTLSEITKIWIVIQLKRNGIRHVSRSESLFRCFINGGQILIG